jgi:integrase
MTLYRRGNVWWSRIEVNKRVYQFSTKTGNKNTARSVEATFRAEKIKGITGVEAPTLYDFSAQFINSLPGRVSKQTYRFYVCHWMPLLEFESIAECRLDRIGSAVIEQFITWRRKSVSTVTVNHNLRTLRRALHRAVEWNLIAKVPKITLLPNEHQREYVLSVETVDKFATKEKGLIGKLVPFLVDTGLRRREVVELTWDNVNFAERYIHVAKGKTKSARRKIPMTQRVETILKSLPKCDERVFTRNGRRISIDWISHAFLHARKRLGLPDDAVLHSTRHTFCTRLGERGASAFDIQRLAGHSSITISQRYVHPSSDQLDAAIALLN